MVGVSRHGEASICTGVISYVSAWVIRLFTDTKRAYRRISLEQEAYANQSNDNYNATRKKFAWTKYLWWNEKKEDK